MKNFTGSHQRFRSAIGACLLLQTIFTILNSYLCVDFCRTKLIVLCVSGAVICSVVGIACWFGRVPGSTSSNASKSTQNREDFLPGTAPWLNLHLPAYTVPRHYDLVLYPDFYGTNSVFYGNVTIEIDIKQATWYLLVHIKDLNVKGRPDKMIQHLHNYF